MKSLIQLFHLPKFLKNITTYLRPNDFLVGYFSILDTPYSYLVTSLSRNFCFLSDQLTPLHCTIITMRMSCYIQTTQSSHTYNELTILAESSKTTIFFFLLLLLLYWPNKLVT